MNDSISIARLLSHFPRSLAGVIHPSSTFGEPARVLMISPCDYGTRGCANVVTVKSQADGRNYDFPLDAGISQCHRWQSLCVSTCVAIARAICIHWRRTVESNKVYLMSNKEYWYWCFSYTWECNKYLFLKSLYFPL